MNAPLRARMIRRTMTHPYTYACAETKNIYTKTFGERRERTSAGSHRNGGNGNATLLHSIGPQFGLQRTSWHRTEVEGTKAGECRSDVEREVVKAITKQGHGHRETTRHESSSTTFSRPRPSRFSHEAQAARSKRRRRRRRRPNVHHTSYSAAYLFGHRRSRSDGWLRSSRGALSLSPSQTCPRVYACSSPLPPPPSRHGERGHTLPPTVVSTKHITSLRCCGQACTLPHGLPRSAGSPGCCSVRSCAPVYQCFHAGIDHIPFVILPL